MMPEKPSPKAAATTNRPASFCVNRKAVIDAACQADPISTVARPPIRSEIAPQTAAPVAIFSSPSLLAIARFRLLAYSRRMTHRRHHNAFLIALGLCLGFAMAPLPRQQPRQS